MKQSICIKEIASYSKGTQIKGDELIENGEYPYLNGGINPSGRWRDYNTPGNTITISEGGNSSGYINYMEEPFWCGAHCYYLYNIKSNPRYLFYALKSQEKRLMGIRSGACMPNIKKKDLGKFTFTFEDDINKQQTIIEILDKVKIIIHQKQQQICQLDLLIKARFVEMFGTLENPSQNFNTEKLCELCLKITDGKHGGCVPEIGTQRYFVGAREIYDNKINYNSAPEINLQEFEKDYKRCNIEIGDFVIVNTGATIGKSAIATDPRTEHTLLQKSVALFKVKKEILNPLFLMWCYRVNSAMYNVKSASAQPNLLLSKIKNTSIYVPDISLQNQFADYVNQVNKSKVAIQKSLDETQLLFDSLMQKYFG